MNPENVESETTIVDYLHTHSQFHKLITFSLFTKSHTKTPITIVDIQNIITTTEKPTELEIKTISSNSFLYLKVLMFNFLTLRD